jgi:hypothetical protein
MRAFSLSERFWMKIVAKINFTIQWLLWKAGISNSLKRHILSRDICFFSFDFLTYTNYC